MEWADYKRSRDLDALQQEAERTGHPIAIELIELINYVRKLHEEIRQSNYEAIVEDDDPEEWDRWIYRSGLPAWASPPDWFIEKHAPWIKPFPPDWEDE